MKYLWSRTDQRNLEELLARKAGFEEESFLPLVSVIKQLHCIDPTLDARDAAVNLRNYADVLRDALAPFDSGVRCPVAAP